MDNPPVKTRFAPSPTGFMHLGNARTALFNALYARHTQGTFLLRIEDTDPERSRPEFQHALEEDLWWLGLNWDEGPGVSGAHAPYEQSRRSALYADFYARLEQGGHAYPCFCSEQELALSRKAQQASGQAPRYSGKCRKLSAEEAAARIAQGARPTLRSAVRNGHSVVFEDLVRGTQSFSTDDIGDFIIRRADGTPAFFFSNAIDDALMQVSHVLRGEDHLANTPRQILLLRALDLPVPTYGHIALIVGQDGAPLSKRHGSRSIRELRASGYLPLALVNYLARLGHSFEDDNLLGLAELAGVFSIARLGRAPARYDAHQLLHWQHAAIAQADADELWDWIGPETREQVPEQDWAAFLQTVRPNISFPVDAAYWARILYSDPLDLNDEAREVLAEAGRGFFREALVALEHHPGDFRAFADEVKRRTGAKGKQLFHPLRVALTGEQGGPEMARLFPLLRTDRARTRLQACLI